MIVKSIATDGNRYTVISSILVMCQRPDGFGTEYQVAIRVWRVLLDRSNNKWECVSGHSSPVGTPFIFANFVDEEMAVEWLHLNAEEFL